MRRVISLEGGEWVLDHRAVAAAAAHRRNGQEGRDDHHQEREWPARWSKWLPGGVHLPPPGKQGPAVRPLLEHAVYLRLGILETIDDYFPGRPECVYVQVASPPAGYCEIPVVCESFDVAIRLCVRVPPRMQPLRKAGCQKSIQGCQSRCHPSCPTRLVPMQSAW